MRWLRPRLLRRLAGAAAASGLALAGLVVAAAPASAAACSGTSGVTVVVDTGGSISTKCASGDPSSAIKALTAAGFSATYPSSSPGRSSAGSTGTPSPTLRADAAGVTPTGPSSTPSAVAAGSTAPAGSRATTPPRARSSASASARASSRGSLPPATDGPSAAGADDRGQAATGPKTTTRTQAHDPKATPASSAEDDQHRVDARRDGAATGPPRHALGERHGIRLGEPVRRADGTSSASPSATRSELAAAPTSSDADDGAGPGTLIAGAALVALVAGGPAAPPGNDAPEAMMVR